MTRKDSVVGKLSEELAELLGWITHATRQVRVFQKAMEDHIMENPMAISSPGLQAIHDGIDFYSNLVDVYTKTYNAKDSLLKGMFRK